MQPDILGNLGKLRPSTFRPGDMLIVEGSRHGKLFILVSGELAVLRDGVEVATISEPGALVGEIAVLLDAAPSASVKARTAAKAYVVTNALERFESDPALLLRVARLLANRLNATTGLLVKSRHLFEGKEDLGFLEEVFGILGERKSPPSDSVPARQ